MSAVGRIPTICTGSFILTTPRSIFPVTTVPRPEIVKMSSIGIKNGFSSSRTGSSNHVSIAVKSSSIQAVFSGVGSFKALNAEPLIIGVSAENPYS